MNGVRRFLGGAVAGPSPSAQSQSPPPLSPVETTSPLIIPTNGPSWPPQSPSEDLSEPMSPPVDSPKTTTAALFFRKDKQRPIPGLSSTDDGHRPSNPRSPPPVRSPGLDQLPSIPSLASPLSTSSSLTSPAARRTPSSLVSHISRKSVPSTNGTDNHGSTPHANRDQLLISLLSSEAVVDSREYEVLDAEEVEELKKEYQLLSSRLVAMTKKLSLETKIRDAAISLSKVNAAYKKTSKQTAEQLEVAERKVDSAQKELWRVSERANEINRKLLEHRAAVLSFSVRAMERKLPGLGQTPGRATPDGLPSPALSTITSASASSKPRFEGAHLFAGHADAVSPQVPRPPMSDGDIAALESKLKAAIDGLAIASKKQADMGRELSMLRLEKEQIETSMAMDLQSTEETIEALESEISGFREQEFQIQELLQEKGVWEEAKAELGRKDAQIVDLRAELEDAEARSGDTAEADAQLRRLREESRLELEQVRAELRDVMVQRDVDGASWETEKSALELAHSDEIKQLQEEMERIRQEDDDALQNTEAQIHETFEALKALVQTHGVVLASRDSSILGLASSIGDHLVDLSARMAGHARATEEWETTRRKLQDDVQSGLDKRQELVREIEQARNEREEARKEVRLLESRLRDQAGTLSPSTTARSLPSEPSVVYSDDVNKVVAVLEPIWAVLPSPEARGVKMAARHFRAGSQSPSSPGGTSPNSPKVSTSLSEMDVRSLKTLYDPNATNTRNTVPTGAFSVESFAQRVQALIADDRALIERLIRFAQAHDLLKKNAERAQKLAQESNIALETYQKQVKTLEDRNMTMMESQAAMEDQLHQLQQSVERIAAEKREVEASAAEQAENLHHLSTINDTLSARTLSLAEEAAAAGDVVRRQMDAQLAECKASLERAQEEIGVMQERNMGLLEELNSLQTENNTLRTQLRARQ